MVLRIYAGERDRLEASLSRLGAEREGGVYRLGGATITIYARKVLIQNGDFALAERLVDALIPLKPHCGSDEAGKGDLFGPLVVAGVCLEDQMAMRLALDSKDISNVAVMKLAEYYKNCCRVVVRKWEPYELTANMNSILVRSHVEVRSALGNGKTFYVDDFGAADALRKVGLVPLVRGEVIPAVAAASIVARATFLDWLEEHGLPAGSSAVVQEQARRIALEEGCSTLRRVAKANFKLVRELCSGE
ncbi:ribonuclease HIII [Coprothermobacteraceae bacterium]|nr:ribonuclease HIII [Coprothermobacteraceae bacterium]